MTAPSRTARARTAARRSVPVTSPSPAIAARLRLAVIVFGAAVAACETAPEIAPVDDPARVWAERQAALAAIEEWGAAGRLGIRSDEDSWSAGFTWEQRPADFAIRLSGPLGQGLMNLTGSPGWVEMQTSEGVFGARTAEELMRRHAGWQVPLSGLRFWIMGRPDPDAPVDALELDPAGRVATLKQLGWDVRYEGYGEFDGHLLPTRLSLENPRLRAKLVVRSWRTGPDST